MKASRKLQINNKLPHQFEFDIINWRFNFSIFKQNIEEAKIHQQYIPLSWYDKY